MDDEKWHSFLTHSKQCILHTVWSVVIQPHARQTINASCWN